MGSSSPRDARSVRSFPICASVGNAAASSGGRVAGPEEAAVGTGRGAGAGRSARCGAGVATGRGGRADFARGAGRSETAVVVPTADVRRAGALGGASAGGGRGGE